jgi:hypothetical protein
MENCREGYFCHRFEILALLYRKNDFRPVDSANERASTVASAVVFD